ncbi:MAG: hypothetical protein ABW001_13970 [Mycobacterium sp.]
MNNIHAPSGTTSAPHASLPHPGEEIVKIGADTDLVTAIERFAVPAPSAGDGLLATSAAPRGIDMSTHLASPPGRDPASTPRHHVDKAVTYARETLSRREDFVGAVLLAGRHGELVVYSQWRSQAEPPHVISPEWSTAPALSGLVAVDARTFAVDFSAPNAVSAVALSQTPRAHFGVFTVDATDQQRMLDLARRHAPNSLGTPGLIAINFHRSLDGRRVINLGLWTGFDEFHDLLTRPGFTDGEQYWLDVAGFRPHYFDVAAVIAA